jgi:outer membrane receptor protein involved in Fe transport
MNMNRPHMRLFALFASSVAAYAQTTATPTAPAAAAPAQEETVTLPTFTVSSERSNPYRATDSLSAARIRGSLMDTPATVNVITSDFLKDIGAASLFDATQYVSGIGNGRLAGGSGILDRQTIRGFENDGRTIDNFSSSFQANLDPLLYERVEIVKGPNAILAPTGTPGGSINVITKSPQFTAANSATLELGQDFGNKLTIDSTGPISKGLAYRLLAGYQDADSFVPGSIKTWSINPQLTWQISDRAKLTLKLNQVQWGTYGAAQNPSVTIHASPTLANGATMTLADIAPGFIYGRSNGAAADWSYRKDRLQRGTLEFTTALTDRISMRLAAMRHYDYFYTESTGLVTPGQSTQSSRYNPYTGVYTPEYTWAKDSTGTYVPTFSAQYNPSSVTRSDSLQRAYNNDTQFQNDYAGNFEFGPVSLQAVAGGSYSHFTSYNRQWSATAGQLANYNLLAQPAVDLPAHPFTYSLGTNQFSKNTKKQLYGFARLGFFKDRLFVSGGVSRLWIDAPVTNNLSGVTTPLKGATNTPLYGALFKVNKNISTYYSHSTNANAVLFNGAALFQEGKQDEFGVKTEFFNQRLSIGASHFQIRQNNIVTPNPSFFIDPVNNPQFFKADLTNKGNEVDIVGGITKDLSLLASFTDMKLRDAFGRRRRNIPDRTLNAMLKYDFHEGAAKGLSVFVGVTHVGNQAGEDPATSLTPLGVVTKTSFYVPARTIYNAGASYTHGRYRINLNVDNVFDKEVIWEPSGRFSLAPYPERNVRLTTTVTF